MAHENFNPLLAFEEHFIKVSSGHFRMGTSSEEKRELEEQKIRVWKDEEPQHNVYVSEFCIGKTPITNANFSVFIVDGGYENRSFWSDSGWNWLMSDLLDDVDISFLKTNEQTMWIEQREKWGNYFSSRPGMMKKKPYWWDDKNFNGVNQPVVGITWYEAEAYCEWLSHKMHSGRVILQSQCVRLPTEAEWEKAARLGINAREFLWPWGDVWDRKKCNSKEGGVGKTTPVDAFPEGISSVGCLDMAGNVWEWCLDWWDEDIYKNRIGGEIKNPKGPQSGLAKVKRGGSWDSDSSNTRSACRDRETPLGFFSYIGFRVALVNEQIKLK